MLPDHIELPQDLNERIEVLQDALKHEMRKLLNNYVVQALDGFFGREDIAKAFYNANVKLPVYARIEAETDVWDDDGYNDEIESINFFDADDNVIDLYEIDIEGRRYSSCIGDEVYDCLIHDGYELNKYASDLAKYSDYDQKFYLGSVK